MSVKMRQHVERQIARRFILDVIQGGYCLTVCCDGEEPDVVNSTDLKQVMDAMFQFDDVRLYVCEKSDLEITPAEWLDHPDPGVLGWAYFVYGNDGWDVISDYTTNISGLLKGAEKVASKFE